ncbi:Cdc25 phosphatase Ibp1 [Dimargaris xerosporica]|nr:Cdc25 phosphatase Ibp1 [Dimargaris xerosporica]
MAEYIDGSELVALMRDESKTPKKDYLVIDVRTSDHGGGHIPNGIHVPATEFHGFLPYLVTNYARVPLIVVHCSYSQVRGPKSARMLKEALEESAVPAAERARVVILRGGFSTWVQQYKDDLMLVQDYDHEYWEAFSD